MSNKLEILKFSDETGEYKRKPSVFRDYVSSQKGSVFLAEANRYHLYVSYACPWAHRTLIVRALKGLTSIIGVSVVHWYMDDKGWKFQDLDDKRPEYECPTATKDNLYDVKRLRDLYFKVEPDYQGRFTVPILWDTKLKTIVNNESSEIIRMLNSEFNHLIDPKYAELDLYPTDLQAKIDELNDWVYNDINNGVYKSGFATVQSVYETHVKTLFKSLDKVEKILEENHSKGESFLIGNQLTEADVRLYTTIIRFDPVYVQHFKCNIGMIRYNYPNIHKWVQNLYWNYPDSFKETTHFDHIKNHYTKSHIAINPHHITPVGPIPDILPLKEEKL